MYRYIYINHGLDCVPSGSWELGSDPVKKTGALQTYYQSLRLNKVLGGLKAASSRVLYMGVLHATFMCKRLEDVLGTISLISVFILC